MPTLLTTAAPGTTDWINARRGKITASTAASIVVGDIEGVKTYGTPYSEWSRITAELRGDVPIAEEFDEFTLDAMEYGNATEAMHRKLLVRKSGLVISDSIGTWQHDTLPYVVATVDGMACTHEWLLMFNADNNPAAWPITAELKAPTEWGMGKWKEGTPLFYRVQGLVQADVMCTDSFLISGLIPPSPKFETFTVDPGERDWAFEKLDTFWHKHVLADIPPEVTAKDLNLLEARYHPRAGVVIPGGELEAVLAATWEEAKAMEKQWGEAASAVKAKILAALGNAEAMRLPDGSGFTFKEQTRITPPSLVEKVTRFRTLRAVKKV